MRTFGGEFSRKQKVSLQGKSKGVESREEVLERTRAERERRKQRKYENEMAVVIQVCGSGVEGGGEGRRKRPNLEW